MTTTEYTIDLYPGDQALEDIVGTFTVETIDNDPLLGELPGYWATLEGITLGGCFIGREMVQLMVGIMAVQHIENDISDRISNTVPGGISAYAAE